VNSWEIHSRQVFHHQGTPPAKRNSLIQNKITSFQSILLDSLGLFPIDRQGDFISPYLNYENSSEFQITLYVCIYSISKNDIKCKKCPVQDKYVLKRNLCLRVESDLWNPHLLYNIDRIIYKIPKPIKPQLREKKLILWNTLVLKTWFYTHV
jgi:hypothetical protein